MNTYITTNIRFPEEAYMRLKQEALQKRKSLSAVIREKVGIKDQPRSKTEVEKIMADIKNLARQNTKYLKGVDSVKVIREMRYTDIWSDASYAVLAQEKGCDLITADAEFIRQVNLFFVKTLGQYLA